jgi:PncC family amidohydrolase
VNQTPDTRTGYPAGRPEPPASRRGEPPIAPLDALAEAVCSAFRRRGLTLATAESCTGGWVSQSLTAIPGSSDVFQGGIVAYQDRVKEVFLGVATATLAAHGAVSAAVAAEMADGARRRLGADYAVSVTGLAGPGGALADVPVGRVYIGLAGPDGATAAEHDFAGSRRAVREAATGAALQAVLTAVTGRPGARDR